MTLRLKFRTSRLLLIVATFFMCGLVLAPDAVAQRLPKATDREPETKAASVRRERRKKARQAAPAASSTPASVESDKFLDLGDRFREQEKWRAAEAAYKEAINVWSGNADALLELGHLYLTLGKMQDAQQVHNRLRSVSALYASELHAEITRRKSQR